MAHRLNASTIKSWFQYRCERQVRYLTSSPEELEAVPVSRDIKEQAWARLGVEYEGRVLNSLARSARLLRPAPGEYALSERLAIGFLRGEGKAQFAAQINLKPGSVPDMFSGAAIELTRTFPDLIRRVDGPEGPSFTIIDVKATRNAAIFHKAQVAYYVRILEVVLREMGVAASFDTHGEIWRVPDNGDAEGEDYQVDRFALRPYLRLIDEFVGETLPRILEQPLGRDVDRTFFHVYFKCEQCDFLKHCGEAVSERRPPSRRDISATPGLTHEGKKTLNAMGIRTIEELAGARGLARSEGLSWSLSRRAETLVSRAQALARGVLARTAEEHTFLMPHRVDVGFLLSVDTDPVDDRLAAIGYQRVENGAVSGERIEVIATNGGCDEINAIVAVMGHLLADLTAIDGANANGADAHAHIFFYEPAEAVNLQRALGRHLDDGRIRDGLLHLVRLFPPDDVVPEPEFRGVHHLPATAVRSVFEQLYSLPVTVAYDLRQVSAAVARSRGVEAPYRPEHAFERPFSSLLSVDVIRALKERRANVEIAHVAADVRARLYALRALVDFLFEQNRAALAEGRALLRLSKRPFRFQATFDPLNTLDLDVLTACELLENRAGLLESLVQLAQPARRRIEAARCMGRLTLRRKWSTYRDTSFLFSVPPESRMSDLGPHDIDLIVTNDSPDLSIRSVSLAISQDPHRAFARRL